MNRVLEPELMTDPDQATAYAAADFAAVNQGFVDRFRQIAKAGLDRLRCEVASDRHWVAWGELPS